MHTRERDPLEINFASLLPEVQGEFREMTFYRKFDRVLMRIPVDDEVDRSSVFRIIEIRDRSPRKRLKRRAVR